MHVMCRMRRRIHACHVSYEEEDTCMSCEEEDTSIARGTVFPFTYTYACVPFYLNI
jgi:hypothetical protein